MTSKEQAEHYLNKAERLFFQIHGMDDGAALRKAIRETIPLTELLEVAKAAVEYAGPVSNCCLTGEATGEACDLHAALFALRATGKVRL